MHINVELDIKLRCVGLLYPRATSGEGTGTWCWIVCCLREKNLWPEENWTPVIQP